MTVIYTSHYMEEVEALCDRVAIMDAGEIVAIGTIGELVAKYAGRGRRARARGRRRRRRRARPREPHGDGRARAARCVRVVPTGALAPVIAAIEAAARRSRGSSRAQANLETAFLALTGRALRDGGAS